MWAGLRKGEFNPIKWLKVDLTVLSTVRWCGAYLCGMGEDWSMTADDYQRKRLELFFSNKLYWSRFALQHVTWNYNEENENFEIVSIKRFGNHMNQVDLSGEATTSFGAGITEFDVDVTWDVGLYSFEVDSLASSYPASGSHREGVTVGLVHSVILAKYLGVEKLKGIGRYYKRYQMPKGAILRKALKLLLKQSREHDFDQSETFKLFCRGSNRVIPLFPYRMQLVSLWEQETNWRVLQASAHADTYNSLRETSTSFTPLHQLDTKPNDVFDHCSNIARNVFKEDKQPGCAGTVLESVRSFLAEWRMKTMQEVDWEPVFPVEYLEFSMPRNILDGCGDENENDENPELQRRMIWICQQALQREVSRIPSGHHNLPSNNALTMLLLFGFPLLEMEKVDESEMEVNDSNSRACEDNASPSQPHHTLNLWNRTWKVTTELAPQDIWTEIRINLIAQRCQVGLKKGDDVSRFVWQDWVDAAMGFMAGYNYRGGGKGEYERRIRRADLRDTIVELSPLRTDEEERVIETSIVGVWMGWPPFDVHICRFEMEHWLDAYDIDLATHHLVPDDSESEHEKILEDVDEETERAERVIESVVFGEAEEVRGEIK